MTYGANAYGAAPYGGADSSGAAEGQVVAIGRASRSSTALPIAALSGGGDKAPWIGANPVADEAGRWWTGFPVGGPSPQFYLLGKAVRTSSARALLLLQGPAPRVIAIGRVSVARTTRALAKALGLKTQAIGRATRASTARPLASILGQFIPNNFGNAQVAYVPTNGGTYTAAAVSNQTATTESGEPLKDGYSLNRSLWYWYAPATSGLATFDLSLSTGTATAIAVYTGGRVDELTELGFNVYAGSNNMGKIANLAVEAGRIYRIQVATLADGYSTNLQLQVTGPASVPIGAIPIGRAFRSSVARNLPAPLDYYDVEVLYDDPSIYWRLEAQGDAIDYSGNGRVGQFNNWGYYDEFTDANLMGNQVVLDGALGSGLRFVACEVYYSDPDDFAQTDDFTMEIWFQTEASAPGAFYNNGTTTVVMPIVTVGSNPLRVIGARGGNFYARWGQTATTQNDTNYPPMAPFSLVNDGDWHMLTFTKQGSIVRFYVDGVQTYENLAATTYAQPVASVAWISSSWGRESSAQPANAQFDEFAYYPLALNAAKVQRRWDSYDQLGDPPLHQTIPIGRATRSAIAQPLGAAQARTIGFGRASRSSTAHALTLVQGVAPGTPQFLPLGRATRPSTARALFTIASQKVAIGRVIRQGFAHPLAYVTGVLWSDSFNRAAPVGAPDVGEPYSYPFSTSTYWTIVDGALRSTVTGTTYITTTVGSEIDATLTIKQVGPGGAFLFRYVSNVQHWSIRWSTGAESDPDAPVGLKTTLSGMALWYRHSNSTEAQVGKTVPVGAGDIVRVVARGRIIQVYLNGRLVLETEDFVLTAGTGAGFRMTNDQVSLIEEVFVRGPLPETTGMADLIDQELALILSESDHDAFIYKGRDSRVADEGLMA